MKSEERLVQSSQSNAEDSLNQSGFIAKYVNDHKEQLRKLRTEIKNNFQFEGEWVIIGDEDYQTARLQYATTSFYEGEVSPRIILYPAGDEDIQAAMRLCEKVGMRIAVRTGGHQYCGYSSTSPMNMQIDLSRGREILSGPAKGQCEFAQYLYDADQNILTCGPYQALGDWAKNNHKNGIYLPMGVCANVHLGGHVHTGGWGMVARSHGLLADHVLEFDIILASGEKETIFRPEAGKTSPNNDDLYYAVLGGSKGGEFGIVTRWKFSPLCDKHYPNSACYVFAWPWSKKRMERVVRHMTDLSKLCASGEIPSDYEFMLNITGAGEMKILPSLLQEAVGSLGIRKIENMESMTDSLQSQSRAVGLANRDDLENDDLDADDTDGDVDTDIERFRAELRALGAEVTGDLESLADPSTEDFTGGLSTRRGIFDGDLWVPPLIQMWMCFTNKGGSSKSFDDQWFESFTKRSVCGRPSILLRPQRLKKTPVSEGLAEHFIMKQDREMEYPFVKRFRVTMDVPKEFPEKYTERMYEIMHKGIFDIGTNGRQHLVSQQQIYAGGAVSEKGKLGLNSYSWREQALAMSHDSFYSVGLFSGDAHKEAEQWQGGNDDVFIGEKAFADQDMRMVAYTFGNRVLDEVWPHYYDSEEKYNRLRMIKGRVDPNGLLSADEFSLKPLSDDCG